MSIFRVGGRSLAVRKMADFKTHIYWGIASYPIFTLLSLSAIELLPVQQLQDSSLIGSGYLLYVLGSDLPDIDSKSALIKRIIEILIASFVASALYISIISPRVQPFLLSRLPSLPVAVTLSFSLAIISGLVVSKLTNLLSHRGFFHTVWGSLLYGLVIESVVIFKLESFGGSMNHTETIFLGIAGSSGYCLHLLLDKIHGVKRTRRSDPGQESNTIL
ncbi:MAG: hypothetical protein PWQ24_1187 [Mesotoga sp.]|nr:hypothetical protein [Mesotoga sp.]